MRDLFDEANAGDSANPMAAAQRAMRPPSRKRFYEQVSVVEADGRFDILLDGRPLPEGSLEDQLRSIFQSRTEDKILYFKADNQLKYGKIQEAVETARRSGVRVMAAITEPNQSAASVFASGEDEKKEK